MYSNINNSADYAVIEGVKYALRPQTLKVREKIKELAELDVKYESGEITAEQALKSQIDFIRYTADYHKFDGDINSVNIVDVECVIIAILNGYRRRAAEEKLKCISFTLPQKKRKKKKK